MAFSFSNKESIRWSVSGDEERSQCFFSLRLKILLCEQPPWIAEVHIAFLGHFC